MKNFILFFWLNVVRADIFTGSLAVFPKNAASPLAGEPQNHGGFSSPPQAAKNVRTIFKIVHRAGIEPATLSLRGICSTNWANGALKN